VTRTAAVGPSADARVSGVRIFFSVLVPFGFGFFFSYLFRTTNAIISPQLVAEFGLTPADLGFLTSVYFVMLASIQLPLGVFLDRFGPRRVQFVLLLVAALGGAVFVLAGDFTVLAIGRACVGLGFSASLMAALKANALWWPKERLPLVNNVVGAFGSFGAIAATLPLELALQVADWREIIAALAAVTAALAVYIVWLVPDRAEPSTGKSTIRAQFAGIGDIVGSAYFWRLGAMLFTCQPALLSYQTLWAAPWLRDVAGFDRAGVADNLLFLQCGMLVGVLAFGVLADRVRHLGVKPTLVLAAGIAAFLAVQLVLALGVTGGAGALWAAFGFFGGASFLGYSVFTQHFTPEQTGRVLTTANLMVLSTTFMMQWAIGAIIGLFAPLGLNRYAPEAHSTAYFAVLALEVLGYAWFAWPRRAPLTR
jgi:MFS family permease